MKTTTVAKQTRGTPTRSCACWRGSTRRRSRAISTCRTGGCNPLKGALADYWSITVSANWRIIFRFAQGDATEVDLVDYH